MFDSSLTKEFSGCISVVQSGSPLMQKSYGYADFPNQLENQLSTRFQTASAGKTFVAVAIMQLVEAGVLKLNDNLGDWLKRDWKQIDPAVTIHQLLCHTSGVPDYFDESLMDNYADLWYDLPNYRIRSLNDLVPLFIDKPMQYQPGLRFKYNNTGYVLLSMIIEQAAGRSFDAYLHEQVFMPAHMLRTGYYEMDRLPEQCAQAYIFDPETNDYYSNIYAVDAKGSGAGGAFTTVLDINQFWTHFMAGDILSKEKVKEMTRSHAHDHDQLYGLGFWLEADSTGRLIPRLDGCDPGVSFVSSFDPVRALSITVVSNKGQDVWNIRREIMAAMDQIEPQEESLSGQIPISARLADGKTNQLMTDRLIIRRFRAEDWSDLYDYLSDSQVVQYEPYELFTSEQARVEARERAASQDFYAVCLRENGKLIGNLYLGASHFDTWELGYVFNRHYQGYGYATESAEALLRFAFSNLKARRITAGCSNENVRSWKLLERLNMRREGMLTENIWFKKDQKGEPKWLDSYIYAILRSEWFSSH